MEGLESLFAKALKLESPWKITKIEFHESGGDIEVFVDFPRGSVFSCPSCGKEVKAYDTTEKEWRHLNFFQYACYLVVRVPRTDCPDDGILQIDVPWAREGADFTVGWRGGISPPRSHGSERDSLPSFGSYHPAARLTQQANPAVLSYSLAPPIAG